LGWAHLRADIKIKESIYPPDARRISDEAS